MIISLYHKMCVLHNSSNLYRMPTVGTNGDICTACLLQGLLTCTALCVLHDSSHLYRMPTTGLICDSCIAWCVLHDLYCMCTDVFCVFTPGASFWCPAWEVAFLCALRSPCA